MFSLRPTIHLKTLFYSVHFLIHSWSQKKQMFSKELSAATYTYYLPFVYVSVNLSNHPCLSLPSLSSGCPCPFQLSAAFVFVFIRYFSYLCLFPPAASSGEPCLPPTSPSQASAFVYFCWSNPPTFTSVLNEIGWIVC